MKKRRRYAKKSPPPARRWHIPPPLIHGPETLEGGAILHEWPERSAVILWQAFRDAMLWATTEPELRGQLFMAGRTAVSLEDLATEEDPRLLLGLNVLARLVSAPVAVKEDQVSRACKLLSEWAYDQGKFHTALGFAQNAALAGVTSAAAAHWVATIAGRLNDHPRAEGWFRRAVGLARQSRDWRMYARSFSGLGNLYIRRGNLPAARRLHTRALRGARRGGMRREQAAALHDLFAVAVETGNVGEAERLARNALDAFGTRNRRIHILAHDVAYFWMEQGHFARALPVFQAVLPFVDHRVERVLVLADVARAAGGVGDAETADQAAESVYQSIAEPDLRLATGRALLEVARGYLSLGQIEKAERAALGAIAGANEFQENKVLFAAESVLSSIREGSVVARPTSSPAVPYADAGDDLVTDFIRTLATVAGAAT